MNWQNAVVAGEFGLGHQAPNRFVTGPPDDSRRFSSFRWTYFDVLRKPVGPPREPAFPANGPLVVDHQLLVEAVQQPQADVCHEVPRYPS